MSLDEVWVDVEEYLKSFHKNDTVKDTALDIMLSSAEVMNDIQFIEHELMVKDKQEEIKKEHISHLFTYMIKLCVLYNIKPTELKYLCQEFISEGAEDKKERLHMVEEWKLWVKAMRLRSHRKIKVIKEDERLGLKPKRIPRQIKQIKTKKIKNENLEEEEERLTLEKQKREILDKEDE
jgi:hypothetical protein